MLVAGLINIDLQVRLVMRMISSHLLLLALAAVRRLRQFLVRQVALASNYAVVRQTPPLDENTTGLLLSTSGVLARIGGLLIAVPKTKALPSFRACYTFNYLD